jgi:outer membrane protein
MDLRRITRPFVLAITVVVAGGSFVAAPSVAHAEVPSVRKLAMVDMQRVLNETKAGQRARKELEASSKVKQEKLEKKQAKLESEAGKLGTLKGEQLAAAQERLQKEYMEVQSMAAALEQELSGEHNKLLQKMYENSQAIVAEIAKTDGIDLVLVRDQMTVIYAKDSFDITNEVVKRYDQAHK